MKQNDKIDKQWIRQLEKKVDEQRKTIFNLRQKLIDIRKILDRAVKYENR